MDENYPTLVFKQGKKIAFETCPSGLLFSPSMKISPRKDDQSRREVHLLSSPTKYPLWYLCAVRRLIVILALEDPQAHLHTFTAWTDQLQLLRLNQFLPVKRLWLMAVSKNSSIDSRSVEWGHSAICVYSEVNPVTFNGTCSQEDVCRIEASVCKRKKSFFFYITFMDI